MIRHSPPHLALAAYYAYRGLDPSRAVEELQRGLALAPSDVELLLILAFWQWQLGRWQESVTTFERALALDPANPNALARAWPLYHLLRRHEDALRMLDRFLALTPDDPLANTVKGLIYLRWQGTADTLAAVLRRVPPDWDPGDMATYWRFMVLRVQRRDAEALAMLDSSRHTLSRDGIVYQPAALMRAQVHESLGDQAQARAHYEAARRLLVDSATAYPNSPSIHAALGLAYAGLGRRREAVQAARRAMELSPLTQDNGSATAFMSIAVQVYARTGEFDAAMELLELLFTIPAGRDVTVAFLRVWPGFDPLRSDPRFEPLLQRFASVTQP